MPSYVAEATQRQDTKRQATAMPMATPRPDANAWCTTSTLVRCNGIMVFHTNPGQSSTQRPSPTASVSHTATTQTTPKGTCCNNSRHAPRRARRGSTPTELSSVTPAPRPPQRPSHALQHRHPHCCPQTMHRRARQHGHGWRGARKGVQKVADCARTSARSSMSA